MDLELSAEQQELRTVGADFLDARAPLSLARAFLDGGGDATSLWTELGELGWYGVGLDPDDPFGLPGLCLLAEQVGRHVAPTLFADVAVTARIVAAGDDATRAAWIERLESGATVATLAVLEEGGSWSPDAMDAVAVADGGGYRLSGTKLAVHHGAHAGAFGVMALVDGEPAFVLVPSGTPGVAVYPAEGIDPSARCATVVFDRVAVAAEDVIAGSSAREAIERALLVGAVATAAEAVGAASAALDVAIAYAIERKQFGRPIGKFQALQHVLSEAHVLRDTAWSSTFYAAAAIDEDAPDALDAATVAKAHASNAARAVAETALQVLGGIGFTWEHDLHLFLRRVIDAEARFGDATYHEDRLAAALTERARRALLTPIAEA